MEINNIFNFGDEVVAKTDKKQRKMIITAFTITEGGITYQVSFFDNIRYFFGYELELWQESVKGNNNKRGEYKKLSVKYLKGLEFDEYINLLSANSRDTIESILNMLVVAEEYEMAEVTNRFIQEIKK